MGAQYQLNDALQVGLAGTFVWAGDMTVDQGTDGSVRGRVSGTYEDAWFTMVSLNLNWRV